MFSKIPYGGVLDQENGSNILLEDGFNLLWADAENVITFAWKPQAEHAENIEWLTDVIPTYDGEQRLSVRTAPRTRYNYSLCSFFV